jgi:protocatechuate 4,5-dioxygenase, beta chain
MDLPIVPISTNVMAPPVAPARRFHEVGVAIRAIIERLPPELRVAVVASGHTSTEVGGRDLLGGSINEEFDRKMIDLIDQADVQGLLNEASWERMIDAGNQTPGFLNYVLLVGIAGKTRPTSIDYAASKRFAGALFVNWEQKNGGRFL